MFDRKDHIKTQPLKTRSYPPSNFAISKIRVGVGLAEDGTRMDGL